METRVGGLLRDDTSTAGVVGGANLDSGEDGVHESVGDNSRGVEVKDDRGGAADTKLKARKGRTAGTSDGPEALAVNARVARGVLKQGGVEGKKKGAVDKRLERTVAVELVVGSNLASGHDARVGNASAKVGGSNTLGEVAEERVVELVTDETGVIAKGQGDTLGLTRAGDRGSVRDGRKAELGVAQSVDLGKKKRDVVAQRLGSGSSGLARTLDGASGDARLCALGRDDLDTRHVRGRAAVGHLRG